MKMMKCNSCSPVTGLRNCSKDATLFCPTCRKLGVPQKWSAFCCQKCFRASWSEHKAVHEAAKKSLKHAEEDSREVEPIICESASTHQEIVQLSKELQEAKEKLNGQGRQFMDYQGIIQNLTTEVANLREEASNDFKAASKEEKESRDAHEALVQKMKELDEEWQKKLDLAESEATHAVKLLKIRDADLEKNQQDATEQLEKNGSTWQAQCEKLRTEIASLEGTLHDKDILLMQNKEEYQTDIHRTEHTTRQATAAQCQQEASLVLSMAKEEAQVQLQQTLQEHDVRVRQMCKAEESAALLSLREQLETENSQVVEKLTEEHHLSCLR